jgi:hypothetical protein
MRYPIRQVVPLENTGTMFAPPAATMLLNVVEFASVTM